MGWGRWPRLNKLQNRDVRGRDSRLHNLSLCQAQRISTLAELHTQMCARPTTSPLAEDNECPPRGHAGLHRHNPVSRLSIVSELSRSGRGSVISLDDRRDGSPMLCPKNLFKQFHLLSYRLKKKKILPLSRIKLQSNRTLLYFELFFYN